MRSGGSGRVGRPTTSPPTPRRTVNGSGKVFSCLDKNTNTKDYKYDVTVTDGKRTLVLDPTIGNEGP